MKSKIKLEPFVKRPLPEIRKMLESTGKYNKKFINELINGLKRTSIYADDYKK